MAGEMRFTTVPKAPSGFAQGMAMFAQNLPQIVGMYLNRYEQKQNVIRNTYGKAMKNLDEDLGELMWYEKRDELIKELNGIQKYTEDAMYKNMKTGNKQLFGRGGLSDVEQMERKKKIDGLMGKIQGYQQTGAAITESQKNFDPDKHSVKVYMGSMKQARETGEVPEGGFLLESMSPSSIHKMYNNTWEAEEKVNPSFKTTNVDDVNGQRVASVGYNPERVSYVNNSFMNEVLSNQAAVTGMSEALYDDPRMAEQFEDMAKQRGWIDEKTRKTEAAKMFLTSAINSWQPKGGVVSTKPSPQYTQPKPEELPYEGQRNISGTGISGDGVVFTKKTKISVPTGNLTDASTGKPIDVDGNTDFDINFIIGDIVQGNAKVTRLKEVDEDKADIVKDVDDPKDYYSLTKDEISGIAEKEKLMKKGMMGLGKEKVDTDQVTPEFYDSLSNDKKPKETKKKYYKKETVYKTVNAKYGDIGAQMKSAVPSYQPSGVANTDKGGGYKGTAVPEFRYNPKIFNELEKADYEFYMTVIQEIRNNPQDEKSKKAYQKLKDMGYVL